MGFSMCSRVLPQHRCSKQPVLMSACSCPRLAAAALGASSPTDLGLNLLIPYLLHYPLHICPARSLKPWRASLAGLICMTWHAQQPTLCWQLVKLSCIKQAGRLQSGLLVPQGPGLMQLQQEPTQVGSVAGRGAGAATVAFTGAAEGFRRLQMTGCTSRCLC